MFDGLFNKKSPTQQAATAPRAPLAPQRPTPTPAPAAVVAPPTAAAAGPMEVGKELVGEDFQNVVDEAAIICAAGEERQAAEMLIAFLKQTNGHANSRVWFMLLDIYQALEQQEQYETLSIMFASRFKTSPPSWEEAVAQAGAGASSPGSNKAVAASGRNVMIVEGAGGDQIAAKTKDFIAASREVKNCKLDISRMKMDATSTDGLLALQAVMAQLRKHKIAATLMGENHVATWLEAKIEGTKADANPNDSPYWMLLLEILQWRGLMDEFEELSLDYTITFEVSGPGWEESGVMTIEEVAEVEEVPSGPADEITPEDIITDVVVQRMQEAISAAIAERGVAKLNFRRVKRMDFVSAGTFLSIMTSLSADPSKKVIIISPSELIVALGEVVGFTLCSCVTIVPRKR